MRLKRLADIIFTSSEPSMPYSHFNPTSAESLGIGTSNQDKSWKSWLCQRVLLVNPMLSHNGAWIVSPRYRMADRYIDYTQVD